MASFLVDLVFFFVFPDSQGRAHFMSIFLPWEREGGKAINDLKKGYKVSERTRRRNHKRTKSVNL